MRSRIYTVKEIYHTLQGEGARTGRQAVFCRFAGCNLWSGHEEDRAESVCWFCDTDFLGTDGPGGGKFHSADDLAKAIREAWPHENDNPYLVFTGGEPLLQLDVPLLDACHERDFEVAIETNGTKPVPPGVDWICVSPKPDSPWVQKSGNELKLIHPSGISPEGLTLLPFDHFFLQPMDGPDLEQNIETARRWCRANPPWRVSIQTHKLIGLP